MKKIHEAEIKSKRQLKEIRKEQALARRKAKIETKQEIISISPNDILFNALSIASAELTRLQQASTTDPLSQADIKKYQILINSITKLADMNNKTQDKSRFSGDTNEDIIKKVMEAVKVLMGDTND